MGRIVLSAGHGGVENGRLDPGVVVGGATEAQEMIQLRDLVAIEVRSRGFQVLSVPDDLGSQPTISWINARYSPGDVALELHADAYPHPTFRGVSAFYITGNSDRKQHADLILLALARRIPQLSVLGAIPDSSSGLGFLRFCRQTIPPSIYLQLGVFTNADNRALLQNRRQDIALGIADGLAAWSRTVTGANPNPQPPVPLPLPVGTYSPININLNGRLYGEQGIIVNGNAYIPVDLVDRLGIDLHQATDIRRVSYGGVVYVKAIDLRDFHIAVAWDAVTRTINLRSALIGARFSEIIGRGATSEVQLLMFLRANNEAGLTQFSDIARLYRDEASLEGVNYDIAFSQMCVETNFLRFGGAMKPTQNNFGGLGAVGGSPEGATFPSVRLGVRAHIQHLKAYANTEPLREAVVDPRFEFVTRGIAPTVELLTGRWSSSPQYSDRILAVLRQLYESAGLL